MGVASDTPKPGVECEIDPAPLNFFFWGGVVNEVGDGRRKVSGYYDVSCLSP